MRCLIPVLAAASLAVATIPAQTTATFSVYGTSCSTPVQTRPATIDHVGLPQLGQTFSVVYRGDALASTAMLTPILYASLGPTSIPAGNSVLPLPQQAPNCVVLVDPTLILAVIPSAFDPSTGTFQTDFPFNVPNLPSLVGGSIYFQFLMPYVQCGIIPPCTLQAIGTTEGGQATFGV